MDCGLRYRVIRHTSILFQRRERRPRAPHRGRQIAPCSGSSQAVGHRNEQRHDLGVGVSPCWTRQPGLASVTNTSSVILPRFDDHLSSLSEWRAASWRFYADWIHHGEGASATLERWRIGTERVFFEPVVFLSLSTLAEGLQCERIGPYFSTSMCVY